MIAKSISLSALVLLIIVFIRAFKHDARNWLIHKKCLLQCVEALSTGADRSAPIESGKVVTTSEFRRGV